MPTQRPTFLSNFFSAFRAHSAIQQSTQSKPPSSSSGVTPTSQTVHSGPNSTTTTAHSNPRTITTKSQGNGATASALNQLHSPRQHSASPLSRSPGEYTPGAYMANASPRQHDRTRRGSDSSSEGFRNVLGADKWYIGGRTATGEERFFKLGVVKRPRSIDRLSLDRLSL